LIIRLDKQTADCILTYTGTSSVATVRHFIGENFNWLVSQLNVAPLLSASDDDSRVTGAALSLTDQQQQQQQPSQDTERPSEDFNPLKTFAYIGSSKFNHVRSADDVTVFFFFVVPNNHR